MRPSLAIVDAFFLMSVLNTVVIITASSKKWIEEFCQQLILQNCKTINQTTRKKAVWIGLNTSNVENYLRASVRDAKMRQTILGLTEITAS